MLQKFVHDANMYALPAIKISSQNKKYSLRYCQKLKFYSTHLLKNCSFWVRGIIACSSAPVYARKKLKTGKYCSFFSPFNYI